MIHRLALLLGGAAAAGVLAFALSLSGSGSPLASPANAAADAFAPVAGDLATPQATDNTTSLGNSNPDKPKSDVQTVYVRPTHTPVVHRGGTTANGSQPTDKPHHPRADNGGSQTGDDGHHNGGSGDGGAEPGDD